MTFEEAERLKREYTDKYVVVDDSRPELRRFKGQTGQVKTVNMSGRALVEFDANLNIGWYDIEIDYLKVVDKPAPKVPEKKAAAKKAPAKKPAAKPATKPGKPADKALSTSDVLAAARGGKAADKPAATAAADPTKMSVADVLAAARGNAPAKTASIPRAARV